MPKKDASATRAASAASSSSTSTTEQVDEGLASAPASSAAAGPARATAFRGDVTLEDFRRRMAEFVREREWDQFHTPRNLVLALVGEVGELAEIFQWRGEVGVGLPGWTDEEHTHLGEELADCFLYLIRLSNQCGVDLPAAALRKMELNARKYPADKARGSARKYTAYQSAESETTETKRIGSTAAILDASSSSSATEASRRSWFVELFIVAVLVATVVLYGFGFLTVVLENVSVRRLW